MTLWTLVIASVVYPLLAHVDVARGKNVGDVVTEIRIERTVYISPDWCANAEIGKTYPAQIDKGHTTVRLRVGQSTCKYHIVDTRPFLRRTPSPDLRREGWRVGDGSSGDSVNRGAARGHREIPRGRRPWKSTLQERKVGAHAIIPSPCAQPTCSAEDGMLPAPAPCKNRKERAAPEIASSGPPLG